jgi:hypothetical protein
MSIRQVNFGFWLLRVITWDAILPLVVALVPTLIILIFPNRRGFIEITSVMLPVGAFLLRAINGKRQIARNRCSQTVRAFQFCVFVVGILPLVLLDCVMILSHLMPDGAFLATTTDRLVLAVLVAIYLVSMIVAMYPGSATTEEPHAWKDEYALGHTAGQRWALEEADSAEDLRGEDLLTTEHPEHTKENKFTMPSQKLIEIIRDVLFWEWDPCGVSIHKGAEDEYDDYVPIIYEMLIKNASFEEIAKTLDYIETDVIGVPSWDIQRLENIARKLIYKYGEVTVTHGFE